MIPYIMVEPKQWSEMIQAMEENARLKAEVERLRASSFVTAVPVEQYERLVKAGDAMVEALLFEDGESCKEIADWNAAKEGKQS